MALTVEDALKILGYPGFLLHIDVGADDHELIPGFFRNDAMGIPVEKLGHSLDLGTGGKLVEGPGVNTHRAGEGDGAGSLAYAARKALGQGNAEAFGGGAGKHCHIVGTCREHSVSVGQGNAVHGLLGLGDGTVGGDLHGAGKGGAADDYLTHVGGLEADLQEAAHLFESELAPFLSGSHRHKRGGVGAAFGGNHLSGRHGYADCAAVQGEAGIGGVNGVKSGCSIGCLTFEYS